MKNKQTVSAYPQLSRALLESDQANLERLPKALIQRDDWRGVNIALPAAAWLRVRLRVTPPLWWPFSLECAWMTHARNVLSRTSRVPLQARPHKYAFFGAQDAMAYKTACSIPRPCGECCCRVGRSNISTQFAALTLTGIRRRPRKARPTSAMFGMFEDTESSARRLTPSFPSPSLVSQLRRSSAAW